MTGALLTATVVVPGSAAALADRVSGPVAGAAAAVVGALLILVVWLARKLVNKIIGIAVSVGVATATHAGMQTWIHHLISTATHSGTYWVVRRHGGRQTDRHLQERPRWKLQYCG